MNTPHINQMYFKLANKTYMKSSRANMREPSEPFRKPCAKICLEAKSTRNRINKIYNK